jgi:hypothetical protein
MITFNKVNKKVEIESIKIWIHTVFPSNLYDIDRFDRLLERKMTPETVEEMKSFHPVDDLVVHSFWFINNVLISGYRKDCFLIHNINQEINLREEKMDFREMVLAFRGEYESGLQPYFFFQDRTIMVTKSNMEEFAFQNKNQEYKTIFNFDSD